MKLLFVGTSRGNGGRENHFPTLARAMADAGHTVAAVVYPDGLIHDRLAGSSVRLYGGSFRNAMDPGGMLAVWKSAREFRPNWIVGCFSKEYWPVTIISEVLRVKLALFKQMDFPMRPLTHYFIPRLADKFIVVSSFMLERFAVLGIAPHRMQILYNPIDLGHFRPDPDLRCRTREALGVGTDEILVGFVGSMHHGKGIFLLAEALNQVMVQIPSVKALWIGDGPSREELMLLLKSGVHDKRHIRLAWTADVREYYAAMDILAMPSIGPDTFGRVSIEAQACGVPVLGSNVGGIPETMESGVTGLLLPSGDVSAWRDGILALACDVQKRSALAEEGRHWVAERFDTKVIARRFTELLEENHKE